MLPTKSRSRRQNFVLIFIMGFLNALTPFSIDMYLPAFPEIAKDLNVLVAQMALTVSVYFIGFSLGQLIYGPLLDRFGRKPPLYFGLMLYFAATVGCGLSNSLETLMFFRFLSALGGCAASVAATAMVRDFFPPADATKVFSMMMLVLSTSPMLAPTVGSFVVGFTGWRMIFAILAAMCLLNLLLAFFVLPEGHNADKTVQLKLRPILKNFLSILENSQFLTYTLAGSLSFAGLFVYVAGSPAIFMDGFQVSAKVYGGIFAFLAVGMIGGGQLNLILVKKFTGTQIFKVVMSLQVLIAFAFFVGTAMQAYGLYSTIAFLFLILTGSGITYPNAASMALSPFSKNAGSAAAMLGFLQLGIGAVTSAGVGLLETKGSLPTAAVMFFSTFIGLIILLTRTRKPNHEASI